MEKAVSEKTKAIMPVHFLGHPARMDAIMDIAHDNELLVVEDCCEAYKAYYKGKAAGTFGDMATYSFFAAHHIATEGEGGMITTDRRELSSTARSIRAFGRACNCPVCLVTLDSSFYCPQRHVVDGREMEGGDKRCLFTYIGYSVKMGELNAVYGLEQLKKVEGFQKIREENARYLNDQLKRYEEIIQFPVEGKGAKHSWFAYPLTIIKVAPFSREELVKHLEDAKIETRPLMAGNLLHQPAMEGVNYRQVGSLSVTNHVMDNGVIIGCYHGIGKEEREYQAQVIKEFVEKYA